MERRLVGACAKRVSLSLQSSVVPDGSRQPVGVMMYVRCARAGGGGRGKSSLPHYTDGAIGNHIKGRVRF